MRSGAIGTLALTAGNRLETGSSDVAADAVPALHTVTVDASNAMPKEVRVI